MEFELGEFVNYGFIAIASTSIAYSYLSEKLKHERYLDERGRTCLDHIFEITFPSDENIARVLTNIPEIFLTSEEKYLLMDLRKQYQLERPFTHLYNLASEETKEKYWKKHNEIAHLLWPREKKKKHLKIIK